MEKYRLLPQKSGFSYESRDRNDPMRGMRRPLYPDSDKSTVFSPEELSALVKYPLRAYIGAKLSPCHELDMSMISGLSGYGRFAFCRGNTVLWLDECENIKTDFSCGMMHYRLSDPLFEGGSIRITLCAAKGAVGLVGRVISENLPDDAVICYLYGGMLGWNVHSPYDLTYKPDMCAENHLRFSGDLCVLSLSQEDAEICWNGLQKQEISASALSGFCAWKICPERRQEIGIRVPGATLYAAPPDAFGHLDRRELRLVSSAANGVLCAELPAGASSLFAVGAGDAIYKGDLSVLFSGSEEWNRSIADELTVASDVPVFDSAVTTAAYTTHALFGGNVFTHGNVSWKYGYLGWRLCYGPLAYGQTEHVRTHILNHLKYTYISKGIDAGAMASLIESAKPDSEVFYVMYETFFHQVHWYLDYTNDEAVKHAFLPILESSVERSVRRLKPGKEWLFENSLNTWISDSHWSIEGQCTQSSALTYHMMTLAAMLETDEEKRKAYTEKAAAIDHDLHDVLWQKRKGTFAYCRDLRGSGLLHGEPELADIYHSAECGLATPTECYQMLDYAESHLRQTRTVNGGRLFYSAEWHPNSGDSYTHSTYELAIDEEFNFALVYQMLGLADEGYEIFRSVYDAMFGVDAPDIPDLDLVKYKASGIPPILTEVAGGLPSAIHENGASRRNVEFGDTVGMFGREVYEGILGIHPKRMEGKLCISPCLPTGMDRVSVDSAQAAYTLERDDSRCTIRFQVKDKPCTVTLRIPLPPSEIEYVSCENWHTEPGFGVIFVEAEFSACSEGTFEMVYHRLAVPQTEKRRTVSQGERLSLDYPGETILSCEDPQGLLADIRYDNGELCANIGGTGGSGVFFLHMQCGGCLYIRPVKLYIRGEKEHRKFLPPSVFSKDPVYRTIPMWEFMNASSPREVLDTAAKTTPAPPEAYSQTNYWYYLEHLDARTRLTPGEEVSDDRWRSLAAEHETVMTGEGIPFLSAGSGKYLSAVSVSAAGYPDSVTVPVEDTGLCLYLLLTGITFPMQSHVENLRVTITYRDGETEEYPLVNPFDICDGWSNLWGRFHDSPGCGFENLRGKQGVLSSAGQNLCKAIPTDTEAEILSFPLRKKPVSAVTVRAVANDIVYCLMGVTVLKETNE